ncbi:aldehyde dehydrogenase family protein [Ahrensia sp. R2A130]|uniref:acylating sulfoacetaldehyde dehydrogenase n=1 Tax=Ahrensia sp. R2A130 TaxID=744979 RepID=UPI0001E0D844|nr:aldehyde dehydrogenase family protein [Ahrensia sp. R2A130]EFL89290.1 succinate-semialdehyde dehydrogenase [Ahrensia sp. R2A130]
MAVAVLREKLNDEEREIDALVVRARAAQERYVDGATQEHYDRAAFAAAWALMEPARNSELAEMAVATTGLGNVTDKITKNHRKTLGLLRDIRHAKTCGIIEEARGITRIARPAGVVGAVVPSTNPVATPTNNVINALKTGNAVILSPSPKGVQVCEKLVGYIHDELRKVGADPDLVQMVPAPVSKAKAQRLMEAVDILVVTGSRNNVQRAYASGTPAIGVGVGNVPVIVDETADLTDAAAKITASKTFDNSTSCSSENALVVVDAIYDDFVLALDAAGGRLLAGDSEHMLREALFRPEGLNRTMIAADISMVLKQADLPADPDARFLLIEGQGIGAEHPESGEKLSLVSGIYRARDFGHACEVATEILKYEGAGHSIGIHTSDDSRAVALGHSMPTCRVIVNQAHCFATGGAFDNDMPFSLSMGCGTWGGNSIDDNFNHTHLMNITKVVRTIEPNEPALDDIFADHWSVAGK